MSDPNPTTCMLCQQTLPPTDEGTQLEVELTPIQWQVYQAIVKQYRDFGFSPTVQELANTRGVKKSTMQGILAGMVRRGAIRHPPNKYRAIVLVENIRVYEGAPGGFGNMPRKQGFTR